MNHFHEEEIMEDESSDRNEVNRIMTFLMQIFVGAILLIKATDSVLNLFPVENYAPEAQALITSFEGLPLMKSAIFSLHVILGTLLIFNLFVPFTLFMTLPLMGFAFLFELSYGSYLLPQILTAVSLALTTALFFMHGKFFKTFLHVQLLTDIHRPQTASPEILDLSELKETSPEKYRKIKELKINKAS